MSEANLILLFFCSLGIVATIIYYRNLRKQGLVLWKNIVGMAIYLVMIVFMIRFAVKQAEQFLA